MLCAFPTIDVINERALLIASTGNWLGSREMSSQFQSRQRPRGHPSLEAFEAFLCFPRDPW